MENIIKIIESPTSLLLGAIVGFFPAWMMSKVNLKQQQKRDTLQDKKNAYIEFLELQQKIQTLNLYSMYTLEKQVDKDTKNILEESIALVQIIVRAKVQLFFNSKIQHLALQLLSNSDARSESSVKEYNMQYPQVLDAMRKDLGIED